jgi:ribonucleoside-triphosphate reductase (thioredoxin)
MQKRWLKGHSLGWDEAHAQQSAQEMFHRIFHMKFLPPGRGLWAMGSPLTTQKKLYAALNNCAFVSTENLNENPSKPFCFLMDASMLGVGVGFDTKGAGTLVVQRPDTTSSDTDDVHVIPDSREGWVEALRVCLDSYFIPGRSAVQFDYSLIRPAGTPINGFGGVASGPQTLKRLIDNVIECMDAEVGNSLSITTIVDIMNHIGRCVVAGNVRQTAEISFGPHDVSEYLDLKNYNVNPHRAAYGWASNNSVYAKLGMDYTDVCQRIVDNGEPGFAWLDNMQAFSRMNGPADYKDKRARGGNPCLEQTLESFEMCCLVETFPYNHESLEDYQRTLKFAYLYAKTVTLGGTQWPETNRVMLRNRRIGCSMSGIAQFLTHRGINEFQRWCDSGYQTIQQYDKEYSELFAIPRSIKTTSIKPSGTVSLLAGATPGMHYPESRFYIRRVRISERSDLIPALRDAGYPIEPAVDQPETAIVEIPVDVGEGIRTSAELSVWEQLSLAAFLQKHWADNQVSSTVSFDPATEGGMLPHALDYFQYQLKGVSFLPRIDYGAFPQMPYEGITVEEYERRAAQLKPIDFSTVAGEECVPDRFCDGDACGVQIIPTHETESDTE